VIWRLFELAPSAAAAAAADPAAVRAIIEPLGLAPKRVPMLQRFSREYLEKDVRRSPLYFQPYSDPPGDILLSSLPQCAVCCTGLLHLLVCGVGLVPRMSVRSAACGRLSA
jgi:endonuclease III